MDESIGKPGDNQMVDCHCHLADDGFDEDIAEVISRAKQNGVRAGLVVSIVPQDFKKILKLSERFPDFVVPCFGVHPVQYIRKQCCCCFSLQDLDAAIPLIDQYHHLLGAIGEVGLDFQPRICPTPEEKSLQRKVLVKQIELAKKYDLPLNVHSRSAGRPTIELLKENGVKRALLHAFDGRPAIASQGVEAGYYFSIPPEVVRKEQKQNLVARIPLDNMLLETDSPVLGPVRQERNEPANIQVSCEYIAKVKNVEVAEVRRITTQNAIRLFQNLRN
ncbi:hypothetical protein ScPMuIL_014523 [Solemya velum]